jgi:hypothetical protein
MRADRAHAIIEVFTNFIHFSWIFPRRMARLHPAPLTCTGSLHRVESSSGAVVMQCAWCGDRLGI